MIIAKKKSLGYSQHKAKKRLAKAASSKTGSDLQSAGFCTSFTQQTVETYCSPQRNGHPGLKPDLFIAYLSCLHYTRYSFQRECSNNNKK